MQKDRAATRENGDRSRRVDYLFDEVADRLAERLMASTAHAQSALFLVQLPLLGYKTRLFPYHGHWQWRWSLAKAIRRCKHPKGHSGRLKLYSI